MHLFWRALNRLHVPDRLYYWLLDRLTDNNGWRPLHIRERTGVER